MIEKENCLFYNSFLLAQRRIFLHIHLFIRAISLMATKARVFAFQITLAMLIFFTPFSLLKFAEQDKIESLQNYHLGLGLILPQLQV